MDIKTIQLEKCEGLQKDDFVTKTIELFGAVDLTVDKKEDIKNNINNLKGQGFAPLSNSSGILVIGLNPAGDSNSSEMEDLTKNPNFFPLYYIDPEKIDDKKLLYNRSWKYFSGIQKVMDRIVNKAKWDWCNLDWEDVKQKLSNDDWKKGDIEQIKSYYDDYKNAGNTIYVADLFYLHETSSSQFIDWIKECRIDKKKLNDYIKNMLKYHIATLCENGIKLKFIYVNNSKASEMICTALKIKGEPSVVLLDYNGCTIPLFFGCMLTGQHAMDRFSRSRLVNEIKEVCSSKGISL